MDARSTGHSSIRGLAIVILAGTIAGPVIPLAHAQTKKPSTAGAEWFVPPLGMFAPTNPEVKCAGYPYHVVEEAPELVPEPKA